MLIFLLLLDGGLLTSCPSIKIPAKQKSCCWPCCLQYREGGSSSSTSLVAAVVIPATMLVSAAARDGKAIDIAGIAFGVAVRIGGTA